MIITATDGFHPSYPTPKGCGMFQCSATMGEDKVKFTASHAQRGAKGRGSRGGFAPARLPDRSSPRRATCCRVTVAILSSSQKQPPPELSRSPLNSLTPLLKPLRPSFSPTCNRNKWVFLLHSTKRILIVIMSAVLWCRYRKLCYNCLY